MNNIKRQRLRPLLYDFSFLMLKNNKEAFKKVFDIINNEKQDKIKVLDLGCGEKPFEDLLRTMYKNYEYIGVDISENSKADYLLDLNKDKLPFADEEFDLVILSETLEHLYNLDNIINETIRVLKKNGLLFISTPFVFYNHGEPYDFYRFTEFYYLKLAEELNCTIINIYKACSLLSIILFIINLTIQRIPKLPKLFKYPIFTINNFIAVIIDKIIINIIKTLGCNKCYKHFTSIYCGLAVIIRKKCVE